MQFCYCLQRDKFGAFNGFWWYVWHVNVFLVGLLGELMFFLVRVFLRFYVFGVVFLKVLNFLIGVFLR